VKIVECKDVRDAIPEILDGELDGAGAADLVAHMNDCPDCSAIASRELAFRRNLKEELREEYDAPALLKRIGNALDLQDEARNRMIELENDEAQIRRRNFLKIGLAASVTLVVGAGGLFWTSVRRRPELVAETINDYLTFRAGGQNLDVVQKSPKFVETWLEQRVDFDISIGALVPDPFQLAGGRLCSFLGRRLAFLHYKSAEHSAALYAMRGNDLELPDAKAKQLARRQVFVTVSRGVVNLAWRDRNLIYVLVSDLPETQALEFVAQI